MIGSLKDWFHQVWNSGFLRSKAQQTSQPVPRQLFWIGVLMTVLVVTYIEFGRRSGVTLPVPFLILYASLVLAANVGGLRSGLASAAVASVFIVHSALVSFGPSSLTGGPFQVGLGILLLFATAYVLGRTKSQNMALIQEIREHQRSLEKRVDERTDELKKANQALRLEVTERKQAEAALGESEERFRQLAENIHEVFWLTDAEKNEMIYISPGYKQIWGRSSESLYESPQTWADAILKEDRDAVLEAATTKQITGDYDEVYRIMRPDGTVRTIRDRAFPIRNETGRVYRIAGIAEDITERMQFEKQLRQSQRLEAVGRLAGGVAHDFNNLLTVILHYSEELQEGDLTENEKEDLREINRAGTRAADLTHQLLAFSRQQIIKPVSLQLDDVISRMRKMLPRLITEDIVLDVQLGAGRAFILADPGQIEQVLVNLVVNAQDAIHEKNDPQSERIIIVRTKDVHLDKDFVRSHSSSSEGDFVDLSISDTGIGMTRELISQIFDPFFTTKSLGEGTGLGLSTVYGIADQNNGYIDVKSEPGTGTTIHIYWPLESEGPTPQQDESAEDKGDSVRATVLLVEDDDRVRRVAVLILKSLQCDVVEASNGVDALKIAAALEKPIDVLLTDVVMPEMDGKTLADNMKKTYPGIKVIFTSGYTSDHIVRHGILEEGLDFIRKPYTKESVAEKILEVLKRS